MITKKQAEEVLPPMRAAVAALHEVWEKCREVERALGRDIDGLEGIVQDMAAGLDDPGSVDADYVEQAINDALGDEVAEADACPKCGERDMDRLVWQEDGETVRCTACGTVYAPTK